jgi:hypothetical protein
MAIDIRQSSWAPFAALVRPPAIVTNLLHSPSSLRLAKSFGDSTSSAPMRAIIAGLLPAVVSQPGAPSIA